MLVTLFDEERIRDAILDRFEVCGPFRVALLDLHLTRQVRRVTPRIFRVFAGRFITGNAGISVSGGGRCWTRQLPHCVTALTWLRKSGWGETILFLSCSLSAFGR